ncbi:hypothetical protein CAPTEDRAFT_209282 [Capitella teleta]|uniref:Uncharacterized protein n=1 Tax=Capitella teleta TaxID=283909 RepID=R7UZ25_CAPTE|nr:hypothetical protein CAPTEDRAFT_209282 [Capitella teleta]|eukprot:ELU11569.1 hypothetical protein CAPTEDRAFT_209282 [Capitella teleta]
MDIRLEYCSKRSRDGKITGEREKRAAARSKNRRQKSALTQLPDRTLLEYVRERQAVEKKVLEEERKGLEEEKMKIEEERKRLAVEKVQVEKMRNEMDRKTTTQSRHSPVSHSHPVTNYHLQTAQTNPRICLIIEIHSEGNIKVVIKNTSARPSGLWYLVSNEGLRKGCLPQQLMLYPGFSTMTEGKVDDLVKNFKEVLNKENYEELFPISENVRPPLGEALVKMSELFTLEQSSSLRSHTLAPKAFLASLEAMLATVQKQ